MVRAVRRVPRAVLPALAPRSPRSASQRAAGGLCCAAAPGIPVCGCHRRVREEHAACRAAGRQAFVCAPLHRALELQLGHT